ncbi:MAG: hypothetical protein P8Y48_18145 [Novosphingobium sp.]
MKFMDILENGLFALGQVLRLPVVLLLWICVALVLYYIGTYLVEAVARRRERAGFDLKRWLQQGRVLEDAADNTREAAAGSAPRPASSVISPRSSWQRWRAADGPLHQARAA